MRSRIATGSLALVLFILVAWPRPLRGQAVANAQIQGLITDASGAVVPNARVTARQTNTGFARTTVTGADGTYVLPNLRVGPYDLGVQADGFQAYVQTGIVLEVSNNVTINVVLRLGQVSGPRILEFCAEVYVLNFDRYGPLCGLNLQPSKLLRHRGRLN